MNKTKGFDMYLTQKNGKRGKRARTNSLPVLIRVDEQHLEFRPIQSNKSGWFLKLVYCHPDLKFFHCFVLNDVFVKLNIFFRQESVGGTTARYQISTNLS